MIIGIHGKINSGKDTVAKIIQFLTSFDEDDRNDFIETPEAALDMLEPRKNWNVNSDAFSKWKRRSFAFPIKQISRYITGLDFRKFDERKYKDENMNEIWGGLTHREFLKKVGNDLFRECISKDIWVNSMFKDYKPINSSGELPYWIITDVRYYNEYQRIRKEKDSILIKVISSNQKEEDHISETELDYINNLNWNYVIEHDGKDIHKLVQLVDNIIQNENI